MGCAVVAGDERGGHAVGIGLDPVLVLPAGRVDPLAEVAVAVHQADRDQRQPPVGGLLEDVAGQHAEAAGVDRQRLVDRVLGAEERGRASSVTGSVSFALGQPLGVRALERVRRAARKSWSPASAPPAVGRAPPRAAGPGFSRHSSQRSRIHGASSSGPPGVHDQR